MKMKRMESHTSHAAGGGACCGAFSRSASRGVGIICERAGQQRARRRAGWGVCSWRAELARLRLVPSGRQTASSPFDGQSGSSGGSSGNSERPGRDETSHFGHLSVTVAASRSRIPCSALACTTMTAPAPSRNEGTLESANLENDVGSGCKVRLLRFQPEFSMRSATPPAHDHHHGHGPECYDKQWGVSIGCYHVLLPGSYGSFEEASGAASPCTQTVSRLTTTAATTSSAATMRALTRHTPRPEQSISGAVEAYSGVNRCVTVGEYKDRTSAL